MRKVVVGSCVPLAFILAAMPCGAQSSSSEDRAWWGNTGATPGPIPDEERSHHWWWPTSSGSASDDSVWGNRGIVYSEYTPPPPAPAPRVRATPPPAPPPAPPPVPQRIAPVFDDVRFEFDVSRLTAAAKVAIGKIVDALKENPDDTITIEAHADDVNNSGNPAYNTELGERRAAAVKDLMVEQGVSADRVRYVSYGDTRPSFPNNTFDNRARNRRAEFVYSISE